MTPAPGARTGAWDPALVPRLAARHEAGRIRFELIAPTADVHEPLQAEFTQVIATAALDQVQAAATRLMRTAEGESFWSEARRLGEMMYRTLVPDGLRMPLERLAGGPLLVRTNLQGLPWELLYDGQEFWGLAFALGTQIVADTGAPPASMPYAVSSSPSRPRALVIGSDPDCTLGFVRSEVATVVRLLDPLADVHCMAGALANFPTVTARLAEAVDLIHYCGHVALDVDGAPALRLPDGSLLNGETIRSNLRGRPIVFLNGCGSASARAPQQGALATLADQFLLARARAVVATLHPVRDGAAEYMATEFYSQILAHEPIGEALRRARHRSLSREAAGGGGLGFVLFGNPALVPLPGAVSIADAPAPPPLVASPPEPTRRRVLVGAGLATAVLVAGWRYRRRGPVVVPAPARAGAAGPMVLWIGPFQPTGGGPVVDPFGNRLSDGLAARLRLLRIPTIYSAADMPSGSEPPTELEMVKAFHATKSIVARYRRDGSALEATVRIIDVETGLTEPSFTIGGTMQKSDELLVAIAEQIVSSLKIVRMMLEGEGIEQAEPAPASEPSSGSPPLLARVFRSALAGEDETGVRALLERYRVATERSDLDAVAGCYVSFTDRQRDAQQQYLDSVRALRIRIDVTRLDVSGNAARVEYTRTDDFTDARTGRAMHLDVRLARSVVQIDGQWRFAQTPPVKE